MSRKSPKVEVDTAAQAAATQAQTEAVKAQTAALADQAASFKRAQEAQMATETLAKNMKADLTNENIATVVAGGSADASDAVSPGTGLVKKRRGGSLSTQLGVNV